MARGLSPTQDDVISALVRKARSEVSVNGERGWHPDSLFVGNYRTYAKLRTLGFIETKLRSYYFFSLRITDAGLAYYQEKHG